MRQTLEAIVGEGGVVRLEGLPLKPGSRIEVTWEEHSSPIIQEEWAAHVNRFTGALPHVEFDLEDRHPEPIEPLYLVKNSPRP